MHRHPFGDDSGERVMPGPLASEARDRWIAAQGGEDAVKARIAAGGGPSTRDLDNMAAIWRRKYLATGTRRLESAMLGERLRELRRARRLLTFLIILSALTTGASVALVVFYGFLWRH